MKLFWHLDFGIWILAEIIPAIIAKNFEELKDKIKLIEPYVNWTQLDIMDGIFVSEKTWPYFAEATKGEPYFAEATKGEPYFAEATKGEPYFAEATKGEPYFAEATQGENEPEKLKEIKAKVNLEAHLMVAEPEKELEKWLNSGVKRILVHYEALSRLTDNSEQLTTNKIVNNLAKKCAEKNVEFGIALNLETPTGVLDELFSVSYYLVSVIQLMSIGKIGYHGQSFDGKVIHKIKALKQKYPDVKISIDGGLNSQNILAAAEVGADNLVIGSAIYQSQNIGKTIQEFQDKLEK